MKLQKIAELENLKKNIEHKKRTVQRSERAYMRSQMELIKKQAECSHDLVALLDFRKPSIEEKRKHFLECNVCLLCGLVNNEENQIDELSSTLGNLEHSTVIDATNLEGYDVFNSNKDLNNKTNVVLKVLKDTLSDNENISIEDLKDKVELSLCGSKQKVKK